MQSLTMEHLITYKKAARFLKNPPTLALHPDFAKIELFENTLPWPSSNLCAPKVPYMHGQALLWTW